MNTITVRDNGTTYTLERKQAERLVRELYRPSRHRPVNCQDYCYAGDGCGNCLSESPYYIQMFLDADVELQALAERLEKYEVQD